VRPTLILDAMGADLGSAEMVAGARLAIARSKSRPFDLVVVLAETPEEEAKHKSALEAACRATDCKVEILHAQPLPKSLESPLDAYRRNPECSINVAMRRAKDIPACAVISPGTTGLVMTSALFILGRVRGIDRAPIGTPMPTAGKELFFVDGGSNVDCKPLHLYQFAVLAHLYEKHVHGVDKPTIALLSNGSEDYKGDTLVKEAYKLIAADKDLNFVGYIEGHTLFEGAVDVMVCDGFIGNIFLKTAEGVADALIHIFREEFRRDPMAGIAAKLLQQGSFRRVRYRLGFEQFGGAPLLGLNGNVVISHGRSTAAAIANALAVGYKLAQSNIAQSVAQYVESHWSAGKTS
jgi:glycerol-3-phosphate acyltransferase PlsX